MHTESLEDEISEVQRFVNTLFDQEDLTLIAQKSELLPTTRWFEADVVESQD